MSHPDDLSALAGLEHGGAGAGPGMAPEERLLLCCARSDPSPEMTRRAEALLGGPLDWDYLLETSIRHAVAPLLHGGLEEIGAARASVPPRIGDELADLARRSAARHHRLYEVTREIADAFADAGVKALALKDVDLAARLYPAPGLRPLGDLDRLVRRDQYEAAAQCLRRAGFRPPSASGGPFVIRYGDGLHFRRAEDEVWVDLQWGVAQREWDVAGEAAFRFDTEGLWQRAAPAVLEGAELLCPSDEDMLLHLCLHLEGHRYGELVLVYDIALLCERRAPVIDWERLASRAAAQGAGGSLERAMFMVRRLYGTQLPGPILRLSPPYAEARLHLPLFESLAPLHGSLDQIRAAARPPARQLVAFEGVVGRHRLAASQVCRELDRLIREICEAGGGPIVVEAQPSPMLLPDGGERIFGEIRFIAPREGAQAATQVLAARGYAPAAAHDRWDLRLSARSREPVIAGAPVTVDLRVRLDERPGSVPPSVDGPDRSIRAAALRAMRRHPARPFAVDVRIVARSREAVVAHLAASLDATDHNRLFAADALLHALESWRETLDLNALQAAANVVGAVSVGRGLTLACALTHPEPGLGTMADRLATGARGQRALQWGRYGAADMTRYTALRGPFMYLFAFSRARGMRERTHLLRGLVVGDGGRPAVGRALAGDLGRGLLALARPAGAPARSLAHWIEPDALLPQGEARGQATRLPAAPADGREP